jgi:two-component system CheB/CheR fusion protein
MKDRGNGTDPNVGAYLSMRRDQLTRKWLRAVREQMQLRPMSREARVALIDQLPRLFDELCSLLGDASSDGVTMRAAHDVRLHASERWRQGFALDELYLELDLLQRCVQTYVREYFAGAPSREQQPAIHETIEQFFSAAIRGAIIQLQSQQDRRMSEALGQRDTALTAQRKSDERLRIAAEAAGLGIFEWDPKADGAVWENDRMFEIIGQPRSQRALSAREFLEQVVDPADAARVGLALEMAVDSTVELHTVFRIRRLSDGAVRVLEAAGRFLPDATGLRQILVGTLADVTQRVQAEEAARQADRRKDVFLATLAHELRNPLAPILNAAHLLRQSEISSAEVTWVHGLIDRHARHLAHLIDDLLDVSRITAGKISLRKEVFSVKTALDRAIEMNAPAAGRRRHRLEVNDPGLSAMFVYGDLTRITQVLSNLLDNAVKYTPEGGLIRVRAVATGGQVALTVEDNGLGMAPELIPLLFDLFEQAHGDSPAVKAGLGIGLSVVRSLVTMHGGTVEATSAGPGSGSQFTVRLPLCDAPISATPATPVAGASVHTKRRVLIVDDNEDAALSLAAVLDRHEVRVAMTAAQALEVLQYFHPEFMFLDLGLPDMSGYEVATRVRETPGGRKIRLVALTGYGQPEDQECTRRAGFDHHIVKPASPDEILSLLSLQ